MIFPATLLRNRTPSSMAPVSDSERTAGVAVLSHNEQGHPCVLKDQLTADIVLPAASFAPLTVAVYVAPSVRVEDGLRVAFLLEAS